MTMNNKTIFVLVILALIIFSTNTTQTEEETGKKEGLFSLPILGVGLLAIFLSVIMIFAGGPLNPIFWITAPLGIFLTIVGVQGFFIKAPSIPGWAYIAGFVVILFMILGRKK